MAGLGSCAFARHYLRNHSCFLLLRVLGCFGSPGLPRASRGAMQRMAGCPIRKSLLVRVCAPGQGLSQLVTSFFASESQGILHVPFSPFRFLKKRSLFTLYWLSPAGQRGLRGIVRAVIPDRALVNVLILFARSGISSGFLLFAYASIMSMSSFPGLASVCSPWQS